ncbi:MAG: hypothetical protein ABI867_09100 [Kofleriaceae bacterium]
MRIAAVAFVLAALAGSAAADPDAAEKRYVEGAKLYNLGKFKAAIVEFEAAYQLEPDARYLFNLAQAHRLDGNFDRAIFFYRRFLETADDKDVDRADIEAKIAAVETERTAKLAADKAAADKLATETAAVTKPPRPKRILVGLDVGSSLIYLVGTEDSRKSPALSGRILVAYTKRFGAYTIDLGGSWQLTTIAYTDEANDEAASVFFTQLHAVAAISRTIAGPIWGRVGIGLGFSSFGNLKRGNPVTLEAEPSSDLRMGCARLDTGLGYRASSTIDFVLGLTSVSVSGRNKDFDPKLTNVTTLEGFYLGVYLKL